MKVYHSREYPDSIDTVSHHRRRRFKVWEQKIKTRNTCSHSVCIQKLDKGVSLNTRLNHLSRHSILVRCKQSLHSVYTLGLCAFEIISHSWNTSLSQYGWENRLFPFLPCNPSFSSLIFTPDFVWLCRYWCVCVSEWERDRVEEKQREMVCCANTPLSLANPYKSPTLKHSLISACKLEQDNQVSIQLPQGYRLKDPGASPIMWCWRMGVCVCACKKGLTHWQKCLCIFQNFQQGCCNISIYGGVCNNWLSDHSGAAEIGVMQSVNTQTVSHRAVVVLKRFSC